MMGAELRFLGHLLRAAAEEPQHNTRGSPIVVLMKIGTEGGTVVVEIEQTDVDVPGGVNIDSAAGFIGNRVIRGCVAAGPGDGGVCARTADKGFHERSQAPSISATAEIAGPEVITIEHILDAAVSHTAVTAVRDDLQPGLYAQAV